LDHRRHNHRHMMEPGKLTTHIQDGGLKYLVFLPPRWTKDTLHPVMLFMHGAGGLNNENNIRGQSLGRKLATPEFAASVEHVVLLPIAPSRPWSDHFDHVDRLLEYALEELCGDPNRIVITGQSLGGNGCWELAARHPTKFAAVMPICGYTERDSPTAPPALVSALAKLPIWAHHGANDTVVKVMNTDEMVEALKAAGSSVKYSRYDLAPPCVLDDGRELEGHGSYELVWVDPEVWKWALAQRKASSP
jgi:predicted peptidase